MPHRSPFPRLLSEAFWYTRMTAAILVGSVLVFVSVLKFDSSGPICTKADSARCDLMNLATQVQMFEVISGRLPSDAEGLTPLVHNPGGLPKWRQLLPMVPEDPWGRPYRIVQRKVIAWKDDVPTAKDSFGLYSCGLDGISNTAGNDPDDIHSW